MSHLETTGETNECYTPKYIFDSMGDDLLFDMDVASPTDRRFCNVPANTYISNKSLEKDWRGFIWMNPPFGGRNGLVPWLDKFILHGNGICLTPDRTSAAWWQTSANRCDAILFINGKVKFIDENGVQGKSPSTGTTLFASGDLAVEKLVTAKNNGLGILFVK